MGKQHQPLAGMKNSDIEVIISGDGPVGGKKDIILQKRYITMLQDMAASALEEGLTVEQILEHRMPTPFDEWSVNGKPSQHNLRFCFERLSANG